MTMIERVARALAAQHVATVGQMNDHDLAMYLARAWRDFIPQARAVLEAMRDPSPEMVWAGELAHFEAVSEERKILADIREKTGGLPAWESGAQRSAWQAMINKAIEGE